MESMSKRLKDSPHQAQFQQHYEQLIAIVMADSDVQAFVAQHRDELNDDVLAKSYVRLYEFVLEKRRITETGTSQNPGFVPKLFWNPVGYIDIAYEPTPEFLLAEKQRKMARLIESLADTKYSREASLQSLDLSAERRDAILAAERFVRAVATGDSTQKGLYIYGNFGVGKTYLLSAIANHLAEKHQAVLMAHFPTLATELKGSFDKGNTDELIKKVKQAPVLLIDDFGAEALSQWLRDDVISVILEYRMNEQLPTCFTSNQSFVELEKHLTDAKGSSDAVKAKRLMQRMYAICEPIFMGGANRRQ